MEGKRGGIHQSVHGGAATHSLGGNGVLDVAGDNQSPEEEGRGGVMAGLPDFIRAGAFILMLIFAQPIAACIIHLF